jgi:hypothetical protein
MSLFEQISETARPKEANLLSTERSLEHARTTIDSLHYDLVTEGVITEDSTISKLLIELNKELNSYQLAVQEMIDENK